MCASRPGDGKQRLFSIPPGQPFLPAFAKALIEGRLIEGFPGHPSDPLALASATIYVPTRRAARALRSILVDLNPVKSAILPRISPLGDVDEDAAFFNAGAAGIFDLNPPIGTAERLLLLARLIRPWRESLPSHVRALFGVDDVSVPATTADAIWLARDLAALMDQVETDGAKWSKLTSIAPDDLADWWRVTLGFLDIVTRLWPDILVERRLSNPAAHRNDLIRSEVKRLRDHPPAGPVIAAGSTGSIPATAELISTIASLPQGAVVLPGLDRDLDDAAWKLLGEAGDNPSIFGHPQYGLHKLLQAIGALRQDVEVLEDMPRAKRLRERIVSEALRPAETTDAWGLLNRDPDMQPSALREAAARIDLVEASNEREEALAVALALRDALADERKTAALVTADRNLARRVVGELARFGIDADDSGGRHLRDVETATLLRLLVETVFNPGDPVALLALVKHPLLRLGGARIDRRLAGETLELVAFRGGTGRAGILDLPAFFERRLKESADQPWQPAWHTTVTQDMIEAARGLCESLSAAVEPLAPFVTANRRTDIGEIARATVEALENMARDETGSVAAFYSGERGEKLASFLRGLISSEAELDFEAMEWPAILDALMAGETVKPHPGGHPRLFIWGALEARLQTVDAIVIGGLNEGSWPTKTRNDPFMSRPMKAMIALDPPERRTGLAAHDFQMALGMDHVVLTRSQRSDNAPTVPSRWLQRLETVLGADVTNEMRGRGARFIHWSREIDRAEDVPFVRKPEPAPPVAARPKHFSVTEIETLRRDPYAIFAKKILKLRPLEPLIRDPAAAERGTLFHDILGHFTQAAIDPLAPDAAEKLMELGRILFADMDLPLEIEAVWWPRFTALIPQFLQWERERAYKVQERFAEIASQKREVENLGITLSGRADRIDLMRDGTAEIIDYKTGSTPSPKQAHVLLSPQLALEAALLARGAFLDVGPVRACDLTYVRLKGGGEVKPESILKISRPPSEKTAPALGEEAWQRLAQLLAEYQKPEKGYLSRALPFRETDLTGDYDHLARVLEWSAGGDSGGEGGE
ncbi:double-strand break repair protein AddB [Brucella inopinata]|uniref:Double-strand break repair protein AddB n=1 Tax=Brucella inopinata TaxID=1218315 RepID=A0AAW7B3N1_9HYPH|nr:double-strand break repair protein AddB [Brucella inopinata]EFM57910.1 double-strand break repair protein AddB [Brucella inopinata BO1]KEY03829.1 LuxR family transcriptional regulator [Brucella suis bv. 4 str. 40]MDL2331552.1 double-strand break repair protein AddB [Brucella inopinata]